MMIRMIPSKTVLQQCPQQNDTPVPIGTVLSSLSDVILEKILENLVVDIKSEYLTKADMKTWRIGFCEASQYRRVSKVWKRVVDKVLEQSLVSFTRIWLQNRCVNDLFPRCVARVDICNQKLVVPRHGSEESKKDIMFKNESNPFLAKSLMFSQLIRDSTKDEEHLVIHYYIAPVAQHLSVLCIHNIDLHISNLSFLFDACKNLRVLILNELEVYSYGEKEGLKGKRKLPSLPKLKTLLILDKPTHDISGFIKHAQKVTTDCWLYDSYAAQLIQLELFCSRSVKTSSLPNLRQLSLNVVSLSYLNNIGYAKTLEKLSLIRHGKSKNFGNVDALFSFIDRYVKILKELHLEIYWSPVNCLSHHKKCFEENKSRCWWSLTKHFNNLYKFTTLYPEFKDEEILLLQSILPKMPNLKDLVFLRKPPVHHRKSCCSLVPEFNDPVPVMIQRLWLVCKTLWSVSVETCEYYVQVGEEIETRELFLRPSRKGTSI